MRPIAEHVAVRDAERDKIGTEVSYTIEHIPAALVPVKQVQPRLPLLCEQ